MGERGGGTGRKGGNLDLGEKKPGRGGARGVKGIAWNGEIET